MIKHIEFWVSNLEISIDFYHELFRIIGWEQVDSNGFSDGTTKIYFREQKLISQSTIGPRHICFLAESRDIVNTTAEYLKKTQVTILRGPIEMEYKSKKSYTIDFKDPDGYILEVATTTKTTP